MSETLIIALINLISKVGLDAAISIITGLNKAATIDDAIAALHATQLKTAADYLAEAKAELAAQSPK